MEFAFKLVSNDTIEIAVANIKLVFFLERA